MKKEIDCQVFTDQLDALLQGDLPEEGMGQLQLHAGSCAECAMQLRVHEHLSIPTLEELEQAVPDELLASVWPRVSGDVAGGPKAEARRSPGFRRNAWLVPTLAAASLALVFSTGFLFSELRRAQTRETRLAQQIIALEQGMAEVSRHTAAADRTANLGKRNTLILALSREDQVSVAALQSRLRGMPANTTLLDASQVQALLENTPSWAPALWRNALAAAAGGEGISVQDLLGLLERSPLRSDATIPAAQLIELLS